MPLHELLGVKKPLSVDKSMKGGRNQKMERV